jgi:hypothetical protein
MLATRSHLASRLPAGGAPTGVLPRASGGGPAAAALELEQPSTPAPGQAGTHCEVRSRTSRRHNAPCMACELAASALRGGTSWFEAGEPSGYRARGRAQGCI